MRKKLSKNLHPGCCVWVNCAISLRSSLAFCVYSVCSEQAHIRKTRNVQLLSENIMSRYTAKPIDFGHVLYFGTIFLVIYRGAINGLNLMIRFVSPVATPKSVTCHFSDHSHIPHQPPGATEKPSKNVHKSHFMLASAKLKFDACIFACYCQAAM